MVSLPELYDGILLDKAQKNVRNPSTCCPYGYKWVNLKANVACCPSQNLTPLEAEDVSLEAKLRSLAPAGIASTAV